MIDAGVCVSLGGDGASVYETALDYMPPLAVYGTSISVACPLVGGWRKDKDDLFGNE